LAFDLAERLQAPILVLSDLDLGMNIWASDAFDYPDRPMDRGKVLTAEQLRELGGSWGRYKDVDGDGITYRTLPGTKHPMAAYFTRGTGHDEYARYSERPEVWEANLNRLALKFDTARQLVPAPVVDVVPNARYGIISVGSNDPAIQEARDILQAAGIETSYLRLRALPINEDVHNFIRDHERLFVVENNRDGQLNLILLSEEPCCGEKLTSIARCNGLPLSAEWIADAIKKQI